MEKLEIQIIQNKIDALQEEKDYSIVQLIDKDTKQIIGYVREKDLIKYWKGKLNPHKEISY